MQLYLIRHAQSENNARWTRTQKKGGYSPDPLLSETGHRQAEVLARFLRQNANVDTGQDRDPFNRRGFHFTHLYSSLMQRAIQTASYLSGALDLHLHGLEDIHERGGITQENMEDGDPIGLPGPGRAYFRKHYPHLILPDTVDEKGWWNRPYETQEQAILRSSRVLGYLATHHDNPEDRVAMVSHGGFINTFLKELLGATKPDYYEGKLYGSWFGASNASITKIEFEPDLILLTYHNRVEFLPTDLIT